MSNQSRYVPRLLVLAQVLLATQQLLAASAPAAPAPTTPPVPARESEPAQRAAALRDTGNQAMLEMRYVDALSSYQQSATLDPAYVGVLYSIARAHQMLGEFAEALSTLERFEHQATPETKAKVGQLDRLFAELRARVGSLQLSCNIPGARVLLRDKVIGITPLPPTRLAAGSATLELELDGFFPMRREIVIPAAGSLALELELHARSSSGLLIVHTVPSGARISVDGQRQGTSSPSVELALNAGAHRVNALREGYDEASVPVVLRAGSTRNLHLELERSVPITSRWWFWASAGVVIAGGVALSAALLTERRAENGTLTPGQIAAPLRF